uniref:Uncharacterized protein n=1 Tax=Oryza sativa subsp. japonica TaxID=39947 RepID=Q69T88_ORYSJ|nr:hypothetical protein [Oryza sativa Japonica Group]BAD61880.1 hypothetical protein [Oryza sativa Japonica Group]
MPSPARAAQSLPNLVQSLELILGDHTPLKNRGFLCLFLPFTRAARSSDFAARRVAARRPRGRLRVPDRLGAPLAVRRPQTAIAAPILTTTKPGQQPPPEIAAQSRALPSKPPLSAISLLPGINHANSCRTVGLKIDGGIPSHNSNHSPPSRLFSPSPPPRVASGFALTRRQPISHAVKPILRR